MKYQALRSLAKLGFWFNREPQKELEDLLAEYDVLSTKCEVKVPPDRPDNVLAQPQSKVKLGGGVWVDFSKPPSEYLDLLDERNRLWAENKALLTKLEANHLEGYEEVLHFVQSFARPPARAVSIEAMAVWQSDARRSLAPFTKRLRIQALETELSALRKEN